MNERDERLRELLRAADPAREAPELGDGDVKWMRQRVLRAASDVPPRKRRARAWALAGAAALLALAIGLAITRISDMREASPARGGAPLQAAVSTPQLSPSRPASREAQAAAPPSSAKRSGSSPPTRPRAAAESAERTATQLASRASDGDGRDARVRIGSRAARPTRSHTNAAASASPEATIAQAPREREPYQLQLTAPGGTRIVWVLTADNGR